MRIKQIRLSLLAFSLSFISFFPSLSSAENTSKSLTIATSVWSPYVDRQRPSKGAAVAIVRGIFKRAGYDTTMRIESWPRTLKGVGIGVYDAIATTWYSDEREKNFLYTEPYYVNEIKLLKRKEKQITFNSLEDLKKYRIGIVEGYAYDDTFDNVTWLRKVVSNNVMQNLVMLTNGQIDLVVGDQWVIRYELSQYLSNSIDQLEFLPKSLSKKGLHVAVSRQNPDHKTIATDFNKALVEMKKDGSFQTLFDKQVKDLLYLRDLGI